MGMEDSWSLPGGMSWMSWRPDVAGQEVPAHRKQLAPRGLELLHLTVTAPPHLWLPHQTRQNPGNEASATPDVSSVSSHSTLTRTQLRGGIAIIPISEQGLSHREVKPISQGLRANKQQSWDLNPGLHSPHTSSLCCTRRRDAPEPGMPTGPCAWHAAGTREKRLNVNKDSVLGVASSSFPPDTHQRL